MRAGKAGRRALQERARARTLQYISDAVLAGPDAVYIDRWLLTQGAEAKEEENGTFRIGPVVIVPRLVEKYELVAEIEVADAERAQGELIRRSVNSRCRNTGFVYAEDWPDWSEATESADEALRAAGEEVRTRKTTRPTARMARSQVQERVLEYVKGTLKSEAHWTAIDAWLAEQAARDASSGQGQTCEPAATRWHGHEAEFEIDGVWLRVEHRRSDRTPRVEQGEQSIGLDAEMRVLEPARAAELLR